MKFKKVIPKEVWSKEKTEERIELVKSEIKDLNRIINSKIDQISMLKNDIVITSNMISKKARYMQQLKEQLKLMPIDGNDEPSVATGDAQSGEAGPIKI